MRWLNSTLLILFLVAGCGPATKDSTSITNSGGAESAQPTAQPTAVTLPIVEGEEQVEQPAPDEQEWLHYNHEYWGITFDYPAGWVVEMPDLEGRVDVPLGTPTAEEEATYRADMQRATTYGYSVTIKPAGRTDSTSDVFIGLEGMVLAPDMSLREWIKIRIQEGIWFHGCDGCDWKEFEPKLTPFPLAHPNVDEIWMQLAEEGSYQATATIYMSIGKLVYAVRYFPNDPALQEIAEKFVSSLEFDLAKQRELATLPYYSTDITYYLQEMLASEAIPVSP